MTAIVPVQSGPLAIDDSGLLAIFELAKKLMDAKGFVPEHFRTEGAIAAAILAGRELGIPPMVSLRSIHVVKGRVGLDATMQLALMQRAGFKHRWQQATDEVAELWLGRPGDPIGHTQKFTIADAKRANLVKADSAWQSHPGAMLRARAISAAGRAYCPDILTGVYVPDELDEAAESHHHDAHRAPPAAAIHATVAESRVEAEPAGANAEQLVRQLVMDAPVVPADLLEQFWEDARAELEMAGATADQRGRVQYAYAARVVTVLKDECATLEAEKLGEFYTRFVATLERLNASKPLKTVLWNAFGERCQVFGVHPRSFAVKGSAS